MICPRCRNAKYLAKRNGEDWLVERARKLQFWQQRVNYIAPMVAKNVRRVQEQLEALREETERSVAERLRRAKQLQRHARRRPNARPQRSAVRANQLH
jgi:hypothetical protein